MSSTDWDDDADVLPDTTTDENADGWAEIDESNDDRLAQERPPHWD